jgi:hypothetical protein
MRRTGRPRFCALLLFLFAAVSTARAEGAGDPIGALNKTSTFPGAKRIQVGKSNSGARACFFREEGGSHRLDIGVRADGAFLRVESGDGPLPAEMIPKPPLIVFAGKDVTKTVDGDVKATGRYAPLQAYDGAVDYAPNIDSRMGGGFVLLAKGDAKSFLDLIARARGEFIVVQSASRPKDVDVVAIYDFTASAAQSLLNCAKKRLKRLRVH